jgi:hypothetical protein
MLPDTEICGKRRCASGLSGMHEERNAGRKGIDERFITSLPAFLFSCIPER